MFINNVDVGRLLADPVECNIQLAPVDDEGEVLILLQPRDIAGRLNKSLGVKAAARSAIGMAEMLAHEIKNPLAGITGAAQLLSMGLEGGDLELTDLIVVESRRIVALLDQVEQFGNLRPPERRVVNVHDLLDRAQKSAEVGFAAKMRLIEQYDPSLPPTWVDPDQFMQVFLNLLKNAAEAAWRQGRDDPDPHLLRPRAAAAAPGRHRHRAAAAGRNHRRRAGAAARDCRPGVRTLRFGPRERHRARARAGVEDHLRPRRLGLGRKPARQDQVPYLAARRPERTRSNPPWMAPFSSPTTTARSAPC